MLIVSALLSDIDARSDPVQVDDSQNPLQFSQVFQLVPEGGTYYVCVLLFALFPRLTITTASTTSSVSTTVNGLLRPNAQIAIARYILFLAAVDLVR